MVARRVSEGCMRERRSYSPPASSLAHASGYWTSMVPGIGEDRNRTQRRRDRVEAVMAVPIFN